MVPLSPSRIVRPFVTSGPRTWGSGLSPSEHWLPVGFRRPGNLRERWSFRNRHPLRRANSEKSGISSVSGTRSSRSRVGLYREPLRPARRSLCLGGRNFPSPSGNPSSCSRGGPWCGHRGQSRSGRSRSCMTLFRQTNGGLRSRSQAADPCRLLEAKLIPWLSHSFLGWTDTHHLSFSPTDPFSEQREPPPHGLLCRQKEILCISWIRSCSHHAMPV